MLMTSDVFERYVERIPFTTCWIWVGQSITGKSDYGYFRENKRVVLAHRRALEWKLGKTFGEIVRHSCDTPSCVNPAHLLLGSYKDNVADAVARGRHAKGERAGRAVFTNAQASEIRKIHAEGGISMRAIARKYRVAPSTIRGIIDNIRYVEES